MEYMFCDRRNVVVDPGSQISGVLLLLESPVLVMFAPTTDGISFKAPNFEFMVLLAAVKYTTAGGWWLLFSFLCICPYDLCVFGVIGMGPCGCAVSQTWYLGPG